MSIMDELAAVIAAYFPPNRTVTARELPGGNINRGFLLEDGERPLVVQRLNPAVFPDPRLVVTNFAILSSHLSSKNFLVARPIATLAGADCFQATDGALWRAQSYIEEHTPGAMAQPESMGKILARFHRLTADLPLKHLPQTVPGFHDTRGYLAAADRALAETPVDAQEEADVRWCRAVIERFRPMADYFVRTEAAGRVSRQVTHGDPKRENFICNKNGQALGLFDLDTAGPGLVAHDLGDCLRSLANPAGEEAEMTAIRFDVDICQAFLAGYRREYAEAGEQAPPLHVFVGTLAIAFELGLRRLNDHLRGGRYFRVRRRGDNLRLAMAQFRLLELIAASEQKIRRLSE
jgi:Ser/Thr protein kinase RdoA (MazF antagonist)